MVEVGISFQTIKSLLIFFAPIIIPRAINLYRGLRISLSQAGRIPPRPLSPLATRALNVLFFAIVLFLLLSLPINPHAPAANIFSLTRSRLNTPTEVIFTRLARHRADNVLTEEDTLLRSKLTSMAARKAYLRFGAEPLINCQFCSPGSLQSYLLYYLPFNVLVPHLFHMLIVGLVTSAPFAGQEAARWRNTFTLAGLALAAVDLYIMATYDPVQSASTAVKFGQAPPSALYYRMALGRPLAFTILDAVYAALIYVSATGRLFFSPPSQADQIDQIVSTATSSLTSASSKLHALSVTRNAVVRQKVLKDRDDEYWRAVVAMEGSGGNADGNSGSIWEEEEVVKAMSRAMNGQARGGIDLSRLGVQAGEYVDEVTAGLENDAVEHPK
ncbi:hypothetical protein DTO027B9_4858 [Paecilomyces variotii]|nr:hypothetical protein DTO027B9_4858 [Paecilomyces variotii]